MYFVMVLWAQVYIYIIPRVKGTYMYVTDAVYLYYSLKFSLNM